MTLRVFTKNTLFMNAFFLMLSTFVVAAAGFVFWVIVTKSYTAASVGLATTLLSASGLLSLLGLAGFDTTFVRFLPGSDRKNDYINSGFIIAAIGSGVLAIGFALLIPFISPRLAILDNPAAFIGFVFFTIISSINVLVNAVFLALKQARYIFAINTLQSIFKIALPLMAVHGDAVTIFVLAGCAQLIGLVLGIAWLRHKLFYKFSPKLHADTLRVVKKFSSSVYVSSILNLLPPTILPLIIVHLWGAGDAAYYYMAFTIAGVLYTIAYASMQSVFAEGSHNEAAMNMHLKKAALIIGTLLVPAAIATFFFSSLLLHAFGHDYAAKASPLLQLFALSALPVAAYSALGAVFKITKNLHGIITMNVVYAVTILLLSYALLPHFGLIAVGWSWVLGNIAACATGMLFMLKNKARS